MAFQQGLSGLNAASKSLDVIGNNIANVNTTGMKASRAEFSDLYASNLGSGGAASIPGIGVMTAAISQQFSQGNLTTTGNDLDLAINGAGFYQVQLPSGEIAYTRNGTFKLDNSGNIVTNAGAKLQGNIFDPLTGAVTKGNLTLPTGKGVAGHQTSAITATANLDTTAVAYNSVTPNIPLSTYGTSITAYDSQGAAVPIGMYFQKTASNTWNVYADYPQGGATGTTTGTPVGTVTFDANGVISSGTPLTLTGVQVSGAATPAFNVTVNLDGLTQNASSFYVSSLKQDGYAPGELTGMSFAEDGTLTARYSNGQTQSTGQIVLANFRNVQGLEPTSGDYWKETISSGAPIKNVPGSGNFGKINSGTLEDSNVDLTAELVNMMTAQRAYQANAQTIKTQDQIMSTLVNLR
ncbi:flagellar hook-basal body complex protein [Xylophilus rhododendri]|uniref:Flagellar hook protein FlgE n=1 Tax=Xylophilus rhododendri TaxID=2697032 RepID=A0A857J243_9BURK|nr:flagellar hook protein FlgE [Xylophilus rhododendri]QHI97984.1 flagellar hook-basal body complex protein [Xylophilus rhododendri]